MRCKCFVLFTMFPDFFSYLSRYLIWPPSFPIPVRLAVQPSRSTLSFCYAANFDKAPLSSCAVDRRSDVTRRPRISLWPLSVPMGFICRASAIASLPPFLSLIIHRRLVETSRGHPIGGESPSTLSRQKKKGTYGNYHPRSACNL